MEFRLYLLKRISALIMAPLVLGHIAVMAYAMQGGLTSAEILDRTQGSLFWALFYGLFVLAASVHAATGLRVIAQEWLRLEGAALNALTCLLGLGLLALGGQAVYAVVAS